MQANDLSEYRNKVIDAFSEKINLSLLVDFFVSPSPADYARMLIKNSDKNKEMVAEIKERISALTDRIKKMSKTEKKKKNADETLEIIKEILDYNKSTQKIFLLASKVDKGKSEPNTEESIAERTKLRRERIAEIKREEENINNLTFQYYFSKYQNASDMYKTLRMTKGKKNEYQVYLIKEIK